LTLTLEWFNMASYDMSLIDMSPHSCRTAEPGTGSQPAEVQHAASRPARRVEGNQKLVLSERDLIKWLAIACIAAAVISGGVLGLWEQAHPFFGHSRYQVVAPPFQLWSYSILQVFKALGFSADYSVCFSLPHGAAVLGGAFFAIVWIMIAVTARDDAVYVLKHPIGSDVHSNGGALFLWLAPIALGIAALAAHRISRRKSIWSILVGLLGLRIFGLFAPGTALMIEGLIWLVLGCILYTSRGSAQQLVRPERGARVV